MKKNEKKKMWVGKSIRGFDDDIERWTLVA